MWTNVIIFFFRVNQTNSNKIQIPLSSTLPAASSPTVTGGTTITTSPSFASFVGREVEYCDGMELIIKTKCLVIH